MTLYHNSLTPEIGDFWKNLSNNDRINLVNNEIKKNNKYVDFEVFKVHPNGQVILKIQKSIKVEERSTILLDLEWQLKENIDTGLTVWLEPVGDKSKLRKLRGIEINS